MKSTFLSYLSAASVCFALMFTSACMQAIQEQSIVHKEDEARLEKQNPMAVPVATKQDADRINMEAIVQQELAKSVFKNDIAIPSCLYMLDDWQNDLYARPMIKRWRPYDDYVVFSLNKGEFTRKLSKVASIKKPVDGSVLSVSLINSDEFETVKKKDVVFKVASREVDTGKVYAQIIGDSYTRGGFYSSALIKNKLVPNLNLVGLRKKGTGYFDEGRGGWTLASYFSVPKGAGNYHGFMHPEGNYRFWGSKEFWITAHLCAKNKQPEGFEPTYSCAGYDDSVEMFDEKTGLLVKPQAGDVQYDNSIKSFILYDGERWIETKNDFKWTFDYGKYLSMFHLHAPDFVFVELGLNDFINKQLNVDFSDWENQFMQMYKSILKENEKCKVVICIPCSTCGSLDNESGSFTPKQDAVMWRFRSWLIDTFDHRENESIFLLDTGICIDSEYGYETSKNEEVIHPSPNSSAVMDVQTGLPHPYLSYPQMGIPIAAFIQYYRVKKSDSGSSK